MSNDYLWDGGGAPDPDVQRLERLLGRLRNDAPVPQLPPAPLRWQTMRFLGPALAAAAAVLLMVGVTVRTRHTSASWTVASLAGQPRVGSAALEGTGRIGVGQALVTDSASKARMEVSTIGHVNVDPDTHVRLVDTREAHHQLALDRGTLHAFITAPPGQFVVDTPSATATDLGCVYTLHVDDDGSGLLTVIAGWVAFEFNGRESFVPADASARTDPKTGPGTPRYDDADQEFKERLDDVDLGTDTKLYGRALDYVLEHARERDAMTLWHLLSRVEVSDRGRVFDALASRVAPPAGVTRDAIRALDRAALDQWWEALGLRDAQWWRKWKGPYPAAK